MKLSQKQCSLSAWWQFRTFESKKQFLISYMMPSVAAGVLLLGSLELLSSVAPIPGMKDGGWNQPFGAMAAEALAKPASPEEVLLAKTNSLVRATLADRDTINCALDRADVSGIPTDASTTTPEQRIQESVLVQDGRMLYELDRLGEAEKRLNQALKVNPSSKAARYYLNLTLEAKKTGWKPAEYRETPRDPNDFWLVWSGENRFQSEAAPERLKRNLKADRNTFVDNLDKFEGISGRANKTGRNDFEAAMRKALGDFNVAFEHTVTINYNDRSRLLTVTGAKDDLDCFEMFLQKMAELPPQVVLEIRFCEVQMKDDQAPDFDKMIGIRLAQSVARTLPGRDTLIGTLTEVQYRQAIKQLEKQAGVDTLTTPTITTYSGRQAQGKIAKTKYIVTDLVTATSSPGAEAPTGNSIADTSSVIKPFEIGPIVDVLPNVLADGEHIHLTVNHSIREFLNYDKDSAQNGTHTLGNADGPMIALPQPLPRFRVRQAMGNASVRAGQTLVLAGGECYEEVITRAGKDWHLAKSKWNKTLLIFVTPKLLHPVGNPVHPE